MTASNKPRRADIKALARAGLGKDDVDGFAVSSFSLGTDSAITLTQNFELSPRWIERLLYGGASGILALRRAARAIQAGDANIVAGVGGEGFLMMSEDRVLDLPYCTILAAGELYNAHREDDIQLRGGWTEYADSLWAMAGLGPEDVDILQTYDDYPVINSVAPGPISTTEMFHEVAPKNSPKIDVMAKSIPVRRLGVPDDVARVVRFFNHPDIFELEMERIWGQAWIFIGHESQVPDTGDFFSTNITHKIPVVMVRDKDGKVHVLHNRCGYKGAQLAENRAGNVRGAFRCPYHGWTFRHDGTLLKYPTTRATMEPALTSPPAAITCSRWPRQRAIAALSLPPCPALPRT